MLKKILPVLFAVSSLFATPVGDHGALKVVNGVLLDKNNNPPQLRGMSLFWNQWDEGSAFYNESSINTLADTWKVSIVRAAIGNGSTSDAQKIIDYAINKGIYVLVDWHKHETDANGAKTFFTTISNYVKNKGNPPNVIYEIFNEPINQSWSQIKTYAQEVIPVIRANSPDNIIVVGTPNYSATINAPKGSMLSYTNIVYAFHFYASEPGHGTYRNNVHQAICSKIPILITEWGLSPASGKCNSDGQVDGSTDPNNMDMSMVATWVNFIESRKLSWVNWAISNKNECSSTNLNSPSASGLYVRDLIQKLNQGQPHKDVTTINIDPCPQEEGPQSGGGAIVGMDTRLEAENYTTHSGAGTKQNDESALGDKAYLGNLSTGSKTTYGLTAVKDSIVVISIRYKSTAEATIKVSDGTHTYTASLPAQSAWTSVYIAPAQLGSSTTFTVEVLSGSLNVDFYAWRAVRYPNPDANPPTNGDFEAWPDLANYNTSIAQNVRMQADMPKSYYNLKGVPLGNSLPKERGIYILKHGNISKMVVVK
jgi:endoglucanase